MKKFSYTVFEKQMFGDTCTPVSVYMRIRNLYTQSALMECSDYHSSENGCSYIGVRPIAHVAIEHGLGKCVYPDGSLYQHHIYLLQHPNSSPDYVEELGLKTLNMGDAEFKELKY